MTIKLTNKTKYKATIELSIPRNFDMEKFESKLDEMARNLAEEHDADIRIGNFFNGANWYGGAN
tara:strand:- start:129 stop:320 length:192 start_codon:yes stop_codon:yes gene_type:complete